MSDPNPEKVRRYRGMVIEIGGPGLQSRGARVTARLVFGLIVLVLGAMWTLDNLNIIDSDAILRWWPAALVLFGIGKVTGWIPRRQPVAGWIATVIGAVLLGNEMNLFHFHVGQLWPILMIVGGVALVTRSLRGPMAGPSSDDRNAEVHSFAMMAGVILKNASMDFRGGDVSAVMGGIDLDLRGARTTTPQVSLDVFAWWGGVEIYVPRDWRVVSEVVPIMAGYEDQSKPPEGETHTTLVIRGAAIMGGIEVKN